MHVCVITYVFGHVCNHIYHIHVTVHGRASMCSLSLGIILLLCYHIILYSYIVVMLYIILLLCILYYSIVIVMYCYVLYYYYFSHSPYATFGKNFQLCVQNRYLYAHPSPPLLPPSTLARPLPEQTLPEQTLPDHPDTLVSPLPS